MDTLHVIPSIPISMIHDLTQTKKLIRKIMKIMQCSSKLLHMLWGRLDGDTCGQHSFKAHESTSMLLILDGNTCGQHSFN